MNMVDVPGLGPAKVEKLEAVGIDSVAKLASMDLRRKWDLPIGEEVLKRAKKEARKMCDKAGVDYHKAPYGDAAPANGNATSVRPKPVAQNAAPKAERLESAKPTPTKPGLFARLFRRS